MDLERHSSFVAILDDDEATRDALLDLVESERLPALCFKSAEEFLDSTAGREASCLIADIRMPGMSGLELQAALKCESCLLPIIFITGQQDEAVRSRVLEDGAVQWLLKPFSDTALLQALDAALPER